MPRNLIIILLVILFIVGAVLVISGGKKQTSITPPQVENQTSPKTLTQAPNLTLQDYTGKTVSLTDFAGKSLLINSWATWCPFCFKELEDFAKVQKELKDQLVIIAVDRAEPLSVAKKFTDELEITNNLVFLLDPNDSFYQSIGGFSMPETIFVDKDGNIRDHKRGPMEIDEIRSRIKQAFGL